MRARKRQRTATNSQLSLSRRKQGFESPWERHPFFQMSRRSPSFSTNGIVDRAGQEAGPVALEERLVVSIAAPHGPSSAGESLPLQANVYLLGAVVRPLGSKPEVLKRTRASHRRAVPVRSAKRAGAAAASAALDKERERR